MAKFNVGDRVKNKSNDFGEIFFIAKSGEEKPIAVHFECEIRGHNCASCKESKKIAKEKYKEDSNCWWYAEEELEKVENMDKMKEFTKSDLKEFDEVVLRNGNKNVFYQNGLRGERGKYINRYEENLMRDDNRNEFDIMQVIRNNEVIWERIEKSPLQIELESLEQQQREIADKISELSKKCN